MKFSLYIIGFLLIASISCELVDFENEKGWAGDCIAGKEQSPIDFPTNYAYNTTEHFRIRTTQYPIQNDKAFKVANQKTYGLEGMGNGNDGHLMVEKDGVTYKYNLINVHFHFLSEHTFGGKATGFEMHMVHQKDVPYLTANKIEDKDTRNQYLVVGTLFDAEGDKDNEQFAKLNIGKGNVSNLDFKYYSHPDISYYHYHGGLTTPNCNMVVNWVVNQKVEKVSKAQQDAVLNWIKELYPKGNTRRVQPLYNRTIYRIDNVAPQPKVDTAAGFLKGNLMIIVAAVIAFLF